MNGNVVVERNEEEKASATEKLLAHPSLLTTHDDKNHPKVTQTRNDPSLERFIDAQHRQKNAAMNIAHRDSTLLTDSIQANKIASKNTNSCTTKNIWERYDLSATELSTDHEMAELEGVQKNIWKRKKFVPYNGMNTSPS